jgi:uncharacterized membrane protein
MLSSHLHYLPVGLPLFSMLVGLVVVLVVLIQLRVLHYAYMNLGVSSGAALLLLIGSLVGSYFNIPVAQLSVRHEVSVGAVEAFGEIYPVPLVVDWPGTVIAVNVGGALIPGLVSLYLLFRHGMWIRGAIAVAIVAYVCHRLARPVAGLGIAMPTLAPVLVASVTALVLAQGRAGPLAYVAGSLGVLIGADLTNLGQLRGLGAPVASIGGAGTFDGIFLTGIASVLIAGLVPHRRDGPRQA